ncbi:MAG: helix-turn-helix transcriptional regulator [Clostridiales bacterium]|jgi:PadR family transcriptional regulator PadR|nr:helix-turn-helix transcriptional regulator [Clostridiales bacterium]
MVSDNLKRGTLELLLLAQLKHRDMYAYEMAMEIVRRSEGKYPVITVVVYPILQRLEKKGLVTSRELITKENRKTNIYHLEQAGSDYLEEQRKALSFINDLLIDFLVK